MSTFLLLLFTVVAVFALALWVIPAMVEVAIRVMELLHERGDTE